MKPTKAPFRCLYDNDTTNVVLMKRLELGIEGNPEHKVPFSEDLIRNSIDETADMGVDVHKLSPGHSWVAWWKSLSAPAEEEYRWMEQHFGVEPDTYGRYMLSGGDMVAVFVEHCRERQLAPFISLRLNHIQGADFHNPTPETLRQLNYSRWLHEHKDYVLGEPHTSGEEQRCLNWMIPDVRRHFATFADELCTYDIDGLELDFMRYPCLFRQDQTTAEQRIAVITEFVKGIRQSLDRYAPAGKKRWLCLKAPCHLAEYPMIGLDLHELSKAGMDMLNLSASFFTQQQTDLPRIVTMIPDTAVYLEMADGIEKGYKPKAHMRLTTDEQFYTAAHLAYSRGAQGVSLFNFAYYRSRAKCEPPFHIFHHLHDPAWLAQQPQHYFICRGYGGYTPGGASSKMMRCARSLPASPFPFVLQSGQHVTITMDMAPPSGGWHGQGRCRIQSSASLANRQLTMHLNGTPLQSSSDVDDPYPHPYSRPSTMAEGGLIGQLEDYSAWVVPAELLIDGDNQFVVELAAGEPAEFIYLDAAMEGR